ncbi:hypothetical protein Cantr_08930 [Candida viswanathii]|uniref:Uncharacterized protein n=1 Tax=Candida viswanathii TaxID=5486 RepID=A0A367YCF4_9ASCO|nr:hypothetical protein Cantr_08930 [Candida viswanathii]
MSSADVDSSASQTQSRDLPLKEPVPYSNVWDAEDDILLMHLKDNQKLGWKEIASHFTNRTPNACQFRWRRLKSGNLKNPPKSAAALGAQFKQNPNMNAATKKKKATPTSSSSTDDTSGHTPTSNSTGNFTYNPMTTGTFQGFDNSISTALAGLNALSNSHRIFQAHPTDTQGWYHVTKHQGLPFGTYKLGPQHAFLANAPELHVGRQTVELGHHAQGVDIGIANISALRNNSIIQITTEERGSILSLGRASVSSLPSKSMKIPHHELGNTALAHLPVLFGGAGEASVGPRDTRVSVDPRPDCNSPALSSLRNGSVANSSTGYFSRSGSVVIPHNADKKEESH